MPDNITIQMLRDACDNHRGTELRLRAKIAELEATVAELQKKITPESTEWKSGLTREQMRNVA